MTEEPMESGPLFVDGSHDEAAHANIIKRRRDMKRAYAAPAISSGLCDSCGAFGSLWHQTGLCVECYKRHWAPPEPIILVAKPEQKPEEKAGKVGAMALWIIIPAVLVMMGVAWLLGKGIGWIAFEAGKWWGQ